MGEIRDNVKRNIRIMLEIRNISQKELAEKMNVTQAAVTNWVKGKNLPDIESVAQICDILDVSVSELLGHEEKSVNQRTERVVHAFEKLSVPFQDHMLKEIENLIVLQEKISK